ncbi:MAG: ABC transporter ATP-binding protein [Actinomycetota bacterium]
MTAAVSFEGVSFSYPDAPGPALRNVSLEIAEGSFALVTGPTGAGKSTFLRAMNGLVPHFTGGTFSGRVLVEGRHTLEVPPRRLADVVAFVPQDPGSAFVLDRVEDELAYAMENLGVDKAVMRRRVEETLDLLALEPLRERSVRSLSGGERQRVAIAGALTAGPRLLVLDEPTSQLDPQGAEDVLAALQRLVHDIGLTVIVAEHRLERVAGFADVVISCDAGIFTTGEPAAQLADSPTAPPVTRLGRLAGWDPLPLTVRDARRVAPDLQRPAREDSIDPSGPSLLTASKVTASYGPKRVLNGVDVELRSGEVVALMGRNGSGKSTLLRTLVGLHDPERGAITFGGRLPVAGRDVGFCPQTPESILFKDTVLDEVKATIEWTKSTSDPQEILASLGLSVHAGAHPRDLSAGQRLLVAVAATVAGGAPVLLLDEPTRGLDPASKHKLAAFIRAHAAAGGAVMFATHDVEMVAELAGRVVMLARGDVIADGPPDPVLSDSPVFAPQMARVFGRGWLTPDQVWGALSGAGSRAGA